LRRRPVKVSRQDVARLWYHFDGRIKRYEREEAPGGVVPGHLETADKGAQGL